VTVEFAPTSAVDDQPAALVSGYCYLILGARLKLSRLDVGPLPAD
jgi:hypothetical protein